MAWCTAREESSHTWSRQSGDGLRVHVAGANRPVFERGFHSSILVNKNGREALGLAKMLKLEDEVLTANIEASARRHLLHRGRVRLVPAPHHVLLHGPALMAEPLWPRSRQADESVAAFTARRASRALATQLADPICRGQLAGSAEQLSVRTCFPRLWNNEQRFGSVFVGVPQPRRSLHKSILAAELSQILRRS